MSSTLYDYKGNALDLGFHDRAYYENVAKTALTGKVMICIGDSYTAAMQSNSGGNPYGKLAQKYGMILDGRGEVGATIIYSSAGVSPRLPTIVNTIISDYTNGYTINGTTYHASDVGIITFMGGANDPSGIENRIGTGLHETSNQLIYGALNQMFSGLLSAFTNATLICVTQPSFYSLTKPTGESATDAYAQELGFADFAELDVMSDTQFSNYCMYLKESAVKDAAWAYGLPLVDMFRQFPSVFNETNQSTYWQNDKLHLTNAGYALIAAAVEDKIVELMQ